MRVFLPFALQDIGGTSSFAAKFKQGMERRGHSVSFTPIEDYDLLFLIVQAPLSYLLDARRRGKPIVQRLDGTWYWSVAGWKFPLLNAKAALIRHVFANTTIYQSRYSKRCADEFLGMKRGGRAALIYNGVDLDRFSPVGPTQTLRDRPKQHVFFTASAFRRTDQILPLIRAIDRYRTTIHADAKLVLAGSFVKEVANIPAEYATHPGLQFLGKVQNEDLPRYERAADVFVFTHLNPPCPNNVIEAMGCGLSICGIADGAMTELVTSKQGVLLPTHGSGFWRRRSIDPSAFAKAMATTFANRMALGQASRRSVEARFGLEQMIDLYEQCFQAVL